VSRLETLRSIEKELSKVREIARHPDDWVLRHLIDLAILEAQNEYRNNSSNKDKKWFPILIQNYKSREAC
jgi:hypothetical protein